MESLIRGRPIVSGSAEGRLLYSDEPLSFWGGYDPETSEIIDRRHPLTGSLAAGCVMALPCSRGSSTTTAVLLEAVRLGTAPAGLITTGTDRYLALAGIVAWEMYGRVVPVVAVTPDDFCRLRDAELVAIGADGQIRCLSVAVD